MAFVFSANSTKPDLLAKCADRRNQEAWCEFIRQYEEMLRSICKDSGLASHESEDMLQQIWTELMGTLPTFQYDPSRRFRGWLACLCKSRIIDFSRKRRKEPRCDSQHTCLMDSLVVREYQEASELDWVKELSEVAKQAQAAVQKRVQPINWTAFWLVRIEFQKATDVAKLQCRSLTSVLKAIRRVEVLLKEEGALRLSQELRERLGEAS